MLTFQVLVIHTKYSRAIIERRAKGRPLLTVLVLTSRCIFVGELPLFMQSEITCYILKQSNLFALFEKADARPTSPSPCVARASGFGGGSKCSAHRKPADGQRSSSSRRRCCSKEGGRSSRRRCCSIEGGSSIRRRCGSKGGGVRQGSRETGGNNSRDISGRRSKLCREGPVGFEWICWVGPHRRLGRKSIPAASLAWKVPRCPLKHDFSWEKNPQARISSSNTVHIIVPQFPWTEPTSSY